MRLSYLSRLSVNHRFFVLLVMTWGSGVRGQPCPPGQITHIDGGQVRCCLQADCKPNYFLKYCERNGTEDTCEQCPVNFGLYKRTSSFAVEPCHILYIESLGPDKCKPQQGSNAAALEDMKNCYCDLEQGFYYYKPQIHLGPTSYCQPVANLCNPGYQPNQNGSCEPCPPNTVQNEKGFRLCRPQKNCSALRLETKIPGNAMRETVCAKPPHVPPDSTEPQVKPSTSPTPSLRPSTTLSPSPTTMRTRFDSESDAPLMIVLAVVCSVVIICVVLLLFLCHRKGWFNYIWKGKCHHEDVERHGSQMHMSNGDNDNTSDNSCYTCADSCLASSNKNSSGAVKSGAGASELSKAQRPLPMLEAYMNMNGKCPQSLPSNGSMSEPFYNSISQDERMKLNADNMPSYKNTNGFTPSHYPNRVHLTSSDEDDSMKNPTYAQVQRKAATVKSGREREEFSETDPLLPGSENCSSGAPTPNSTPALRSILRNGHNRQDPQRNEGEAQPAGAGDGSVGNRPHLSMLLNAAEDTSHLVTEESQAANVPHLSQLMSAQGSVQGAGPQPMPQLQHQQLLQQQAPKPEPQGHELMPQRPQQGSPLAARLIPVSLATQPPQLNPNLVQMEELKPVLPLSPGPGQGIVPLSPIGVTGASPQDAERSRSPARISPTQQEIRASGSPKTIVQRPVLNEGVPIAAGPAAADNVKKDENGKASAKQDKITLESDAGGTKKKEVNEETSRKQAAVATSPGSEETMHKSVCGSSGLGDSLEFSSPLDLPSEEDGRSRTMYRRSNSEASRSVSPVHQLPPSRSISTPEEKHRPFAVVKPMQSDQSLNAMSDSQDRLTELTQQLDAAGHQFPLTSLGGRSPRRQSSQASSDDSEQTRPKTPDSLSEEEDIEDVESGGQDENEERTHTRFYGDNDHEQAEGADRQNKRSGGSSEK